MPRNHFDIFKHHGGGTNPQFRHQWYLSTKESGTLLALYYLVYVPELITFK